MFDGNIGEAQDFPVVLAAAEIFKPTRTFDGSLLAMGEWPNGCDSVSVSRRDAKATLALTAAEGFRRVVGSWNSFFSGDILARIRLP